MKVVLLVLILLKLTLCRDFYIGMFKKNDLLVAQDTLYKQKVPFKPVYAKYGRIFTCPITYFRVIDRLGVGQGPNIRILRGGLRHRYIVISIASVYNNPIAVDIYVGCENKMKTTRRSSSTSKSTSAKTTSESVTHGPYTTDVHTTENNPKTDSNKVTSITTGIPPNNTNATI